MLYFVYFVVVARTAPHNERVATCHTRRHTSRPMSKGGGTGRRIIYSTQGRSLPRPRTSQGLGRQKLNSMDTSITGERVVVSAWLCVVVGVVSVRRGYARLASVVSLCRKPILLVALDAFWTRFSRSFRPRRRKPGSHKASPNPKPNPNPNPARP